MKEIVITCMFFLQQVQLLHAAPPIESCPHDSVLVEDTCKCHTETCTKPPCLYELSIAVKGSDIPGNCCTIYSCEGCTNDTLLDGKCPCAPGAILNAKGECECVDPHKSLINNECVCDPNRCELPHLCEENSVSIADHDGCCVKTKCIKCPAGSYPTNNNDEAVEDKCVCYPCSKKECGPGEKVVIMQRGNGFPGSCCDIYTCEEEKDFVGKKCVVDGVVYGDGEIWGTSDTQKCECHGGISFCTKSTEEEESFRSCHKEGSVYKHNESWMLDSCTNCTCFNGETKCISHMCEVSQGHLKKPECQLLNCSKVCPDGYKLNKRGCKICKCNYPYKYDDILHKYNITKNELKDILDDYFAHNQSISISTTTIVSTTVSSFANFSNEERYTTPFTELEDYSYIKAVSWIIVGLLVGLLSVALVIIGMRWMSGRKKGSYDTNPARATSYERMNLTKSSLFNNNYIGTVNKSEKNIKAGV